MNVSWLPDFPEPGEGSRGLLNSYVYVFNSSSLFRNIITEVGEVSHFPYCFIFQYGGRLDHRMCTSTGGGVC
jgi:hypothetical protein